MKRLLLIRHAKSAWDTGAKDDHARPLDKRGRRDAPRVAAELEDLGWLPERVVCSDAARAVETWERMQATLRDEIPVETTHDLYHAGFGAVQQVVSGVSDDVGTLALVGHNPGWEEAAAWLSGVSVRVTTGNAVLLRSDAGTWAEAVGRPGGFELVDVVRPKEL